MHPTRKAPLSREDAVECNAVVIRKAQSDAQLLASRLQSAPRRVVIKCYANEIRKLARILPDRAQDRGNVRGAVAV